MPTAGIINTNLMVIKIGGTAISCITDASLSLSNDTREVTCRETGDDKAFLPGIRSWTMSGSANLAFDAGTGFETLRAAWQGNTKLTVVFGSSAAGDKSYSGDAYLTSLEASASGIGQNTTFSFSLQGTGALTAS